MDILTTITEKVNPPAGGGDSPLDLFLEHLPLRPYATDRLGAMYHLPQALAIRKRHIQPNSENDLFWLVYDVDRSTAHFDWQDVHAPPPNLTVMNRENGHAHLLYGLEVPVYKQPTARPAPLRYAASVDIAMTVKLQADPGYQKLVCKNPLHNFWDVKIWQTYAYDLGELADYLDLTAYNDRRKLLPPIGLGRNCTMFYSTANWAYTKIRENFFGVDFFVYETTAYAGKRNDEFPAPLPFSEVRATGKSVGKWVWKHMTREGFDAWGNGRRKKSIKVRQRKSADRTDEIRVYKAEHPEASIRAISEKLGYSLGKISQALRG